MRRAWTVVLVVAVLYLVSGWALDSGSGLTRTATLNHVQTTGQSSERVSAINLDGLAASSIARPGLAVQWQGVWNVPATGLYDLALDSLGAAAWSIDTQLATSDAAGGVRTVWLAAGFHRIDVSYTYPAGNPKLVALAARTGETLRPLAGGALRPRAPTRPWLRAAGVTVRFALGLALLVALVGVVRSSAGALARWWSSVRPSGAGIPVPSARVVAGGILAVILIHGALLRLDAITGRYGVVSSPRWVAALQTRAFPAPHAIGPAAFRWEPMPLYEHLDGPPTHYRGDPYTYLLAAREMTSFYAAHYREPMFPFATRVSLAVFDNQDVAVSFASMAFSVLAIWLCYIVGAAAWSRPAGLVAAVGYSINYDAVSLASLGWRDDAYVAAVLAGAYWILKCWREFRAPAQLVRVGPWQVERAYLSAIALGVSAGFVVLVRFMAVSFLVPGIVVVLVAPGLSWRRRLTAGGLIVLAAALVSGPYFVNCWRVYGDPLFTFNVHGDVYSVAEGKGATHHGTLAYVYGKLTERPVQFIDTIAQGMTTYPFAGKWPGLDPWLAGLGRWTSYAALAGCLVLAVSAQGRLLLVIMVASLVPFSYTWTVDPHWRFTAHAYPFLLVAAAAGAGAAIGIVRRFLIGAPPARGAGASAPRSASAWAAAAVLVALSAWLVARVLPAGVFAEDLRMKSDAMVTAGTRDWAFFPGAWSDVTGAGNVRSRVAIREGDLSIPLPEVDDYPMTLRLDPFPRPLADSPAPLPVLEVVLNGTPVAQWQLTWNPDRVGSYDVTLPRASVRRGTNAVRLRVREGGAFALWYVRVHPPR